LDNVIKAIFSISKRIGSWSADFRIDFMQAVQVLKYDLFSRAEIPRQNANCSTALIFAMI